MKKTLAATLLCALLLSLCACADGTAHVHEYSSSRVDPGCENGGYTVYRCKCGDEYIDDFTDPLGHENVLLSRTEPTCTEGGRVSYVCLRCGKPLKEAPAPKPAARLMSDASSSGTVSANARTTAWQQFISRFSFTPYS